MPDLAQMFIFMLAVGTVFPALIALALWLPIPKCGRCHIRPRVEGVFLCEHCGG